MNKITLVLFNKKAEFKEIKHFYFEGGKAYEAWKDAESFCKENKLYAHLLYSFEGRKFKKFRNHEAFKKILENLGWEFTDNNELITDY